MLARFCAYGFLKNQRYFEPYLMLILLDRGLSFFWIGLLEAIRAVVSNLLEVPSGAIADTWGRRRSMVLSFVAYLASFVTFAYSGDTVPLLVLAVVLFGVGDAFRSGTHKAMIRTYLSLEGREDELTSFYGKTRSWSKLGSAVSVVIGAVWIAWTGDLNGLFFLVIPPYILDLLNLATYPKELDGAANGGVSVRSIFRHLRDVAKEVISSRPLRGLLMESAGFMGVFRSTKDYLQPILFGIATVMVVTWFGLEDATEIQRVAYLIGPVYFVLFIVSAFASRFAAKFSKQAGGEDAAGRTLWALFTLSFAFVLVGDLLSGASWLLVLALAFLYVLEALWRPTFLSRIDAHSLEHHGATVLSVESQGRSITTAVLAPALGAALDYWTVDSSPQWWILGAVGVLVGTIFWLRSTNSTST